MDLFLRTLKAVADSSRLRILRVLSGGSFNVAELTEILGIGQSTVSRHLRTLSEAGLVEVRRTGTWAYYSLAPQEGHPFPARLVELLQEELEGVEDGDRLAVERTLARRRSATSEFFRQTASEWDALRERALGGTRPMEWLVAHIAPGGVVVDLGTGTGVLLESLGPEARRAIGIDASPEMLEVARSRTTGLANAELRLGTLEHLPLSDGEADTMVANMVLHHVADPSGVFREVHRGLAAGGRLLIADLGEHDEEAFWKALGARWPGFRPQEVHEWLEAAGFDVVETEELALESSNGSGAKRPSAFLIEARRRD